MQGGGEEESTTAGCDSCEAWYMMFKAGDGATKRGKERNSREDIGKGGKTERTCFLYGRVHTGTIVVG